MQGNKEWRHSSNRGVGNASRSHVLYLSILTIRVHQGHMFYIWVSWPSEYTVQVVCKWAVAVCEAGSNKCTIWNVKSRWQSLSNLFVMTKRTFPLSILLFQQFDVWQLSVYLCFTCGLEVDYCRRRNNITCIKTNKKTKQQHRADTCSHLKAWRVLEQSHVCFVTTRNVFLVLISTSPVHSPSFISNPLPTFPMH